MRRLALLLLFLVVVPTAARAEPTRTVDHGRVRLSDVFPSAPEKLGEVDLGLAPAPGKSRLLAKTEVEARLREAGLDPALVTLPLSIRLVGASRRMTAQELSDAMRPALLKALPEGVTLTRAEPTHDVLVAPCAAVRSVDIPKPPRQKGAFRSTATVELGCEASSTVRVTVPVMLDVGEGACRPDIVKGTHVALILEGRSVRISAQGSAQGDVNIGDTFNALVLATSRVVRARLITRDEAQVLDTR